MRLTLQNHIVCADYGQVHLDARVVGQIINYTAETWQPDRPKKERECNIEQGKIAEEITERFIRQYYSQELSLKTYDEIRNDDFKKHALENRNGQHCFYRRSNQAGYCKNT